MRRGLLTAAGRFGWQPARLPSRRDIGIVGLSNSAGDSHDRERQEAGTSM
jgi:hypothetical protein